MCTRCMWRESGEKGGVREGKGMGGGDGERERDLNRREREGKGEWSKIYM